MEEEQREIERESVCVRYGDDDDYDDDDDDDGNDGNDSDDDI